MRKIITTILASALLLSCSDKTSYTIQGSVEGMENGVKIFMTEDGRAKFVVDSTTVQDGKFTFEGKVEKPVVRYILTENDVYEKRHQSEPPFSMSVSSLIVLEPGKTKLHLVRHDSASPFFVAKASGSKLTTKNSDFWYNMGKTGAPDSEGLLSYVKDNADNVIGLHFFGLGVDLMGFRMEQLQELAPLFADRASEDRGAEKVMKYIETLEANAPIGSKFIDLKAKTPEGKDISLSDYAGKGKPVLVEFWASWCPPCREDMPIVAEKYQKYKDLGLKIVGISLDTDNEAWKKGITDLNITWPQMSSLQEWKENELRTTYGVPHIPFLFLLDGEGTIVSKAFNIYDLDEKLEGLLSK